MRCVDGIELRGEGHEGGVAELGDEAAREIARQARAVLLPRERGTVDVGLAVAGALPAMGEGNVQLDHEVAVARRVHRAVRGVAALDDPRKGQGGELALGEALVDAGPDGRALSGVLANGERMQETQPPRIRDALERLGCALVVVVGGTLQERGVAREKVEVPLGFDRHFGTALCYAAVVRALTYYDSVV